MLLRRKRFEMTEKARKAALLETMISDFLRIAADLAQQIAVEEDRTKIRDTGHFAYSTFAKAAALRRSNLLTSVTDLKTKLDAAKRELDEVTEQLRDLELAHSDTPSPIGVAALGQSGICYRPRSPRHIHRQ
jgi:flagellar FliJ protein